MFRFANPEYLYFLIIVPILLLLFFWELYSRKRKLGKLGDADLLKVLMPQVSLKRRWLKFILVLLAVVCLILTMARPQMGMNVDTKERKGIEMVVALDVSNSMLATDVSPQRLDKAKMLISNIADRLTNDKVALVVYAGQAFIQLPITSDFVSAKMFLDAISPNMVAAQGTNIGEAIHLSMNSFTKQKAVQRAIVVITDGEDQAEDAEAAAAEAAKKGIHIYVLGIGSAKGSTIPTSGGGMLCDKEGNIVITKLNEDMCNRIATAGRGAYIHVDNSNIAQERLYYELNKLEKTDLGTTVYSDYAEQFQIFAIIALLLLILDVLILDKATNYFKGLKRMVLGKKYMLIVCLLFQCAVGTLHAQNMEKVYMHKGNKAYLQKNYAEAETYYRKALEQNAQNARVHYNLGNTLLFQQKAKDAMKEYEKAAPLEKNALFKAPIYHNMGVILQSQKQFGPAIECYKEALRNRPDDDETRYNLALCQYQLKKQPQDQQKDKDEKNDDQQQQKKENTQSDKDQQKDQNKPKGQKNEMSKDNADQLLRAAQMKENRTQDKVRKAQMHSSRQQMEKNW